MMSAQGKKSSGKKQGKEGSGLKIGLALSGGGFRASIFHLGVIRRLEERGIMKDVDVISSVSGGSIIAAYYVCEMEKELRGRRDEYREHPHATRLAAYERIAGRFLRAVEKNMRTRAFLFSPFYHPWLFVKSLWPKYSRSDLIREEYDRHLFDRVTVDQLPTERVEDMDENGWTLAGPRLVINTTSLHTGKRVSFSRAPVSGLSEFEQPNENGLLLSQVVGASSCVPGLMPPTPVLGDMLVDGGVSDNQGIEGLTENGCNVLIVSDASGQMEALNTVGTGAVSVFMRVTSIFQSEIRRKLLERLPSLRHIKSQSADCGVSTPVKEFAFVHLFLNLKDRAQESGNPNIPRVPSEYIPGLGRIRTDLDQFSHIETEALMYHGYTLIEAQIEKYCTTTLSMRYPAAAQPMWKPSLFQEDIGQAGCLSRRVSIRKELERGSTASFILRTFAKRRWFTSGSVFTYLAWWWSSAKKITEVLERYVFLPFSDEVSDCLKLVQKTVPDEVDSFLQNTPWPVDEKETALLAVWALLLYLWTFGLYVFIRLCTKALDDLQYRTLAGAGPLSKQWGPKDSSESPKD